MQNILVIAEMSGNTAKSQRTLPIVDAAAEAGAHAIKLQTYTADTMTLDTRGGFEINDLILWAGRIFDLYKQALPWEWHFPIMERARELG